jgi:hypothetical protein
VKVDWAIPCRYVEVPTGGATIVGAGADLVVIAAVPAAVPVLFAVRFVGDPDELDGETQHAVACRLFDPDGNLMGAQEGQIVSDVEQIVPGYLADVTMPMGVVIDAKRFGTYGVEFEIDGHAARVPVHVVQAPQQS